jgi:hypothetical protein
MSFQNTVIKISSLVFIITLVVIGFSLYNNKSSVVYPPVIANCPDYWLEKPSNDNDTNICFNTNKLGKSSCEKNKDFTGSLWTGGDGNCNKYKWAKSCNLTWDGITNSINICK